MKNGLFALSFFLIFLPLESQALPSKISSSGESMVVVSPTAHQWGAYDAQGNLVREGIASAGADYCPDMGRQCHTYTGRFRVRSLGDAGCTSPTFPMPHGGGPMPYCMYFNSQQALHGFPHVNTARNASHGCVRMLTSDARWLRYNFVHIGTLVEVQSY
jgi:lipoprotein-anchoring transpeptidase ErfK/SrfK